MIPIFCNRRFNLLAGAELNRICAANECGGKNKTAKYAPRISKSIHHPTVPLAKVRATGAVDSALATIDNCFGFSLRAIAKDFFGCRC